MKDKHGEHPFGDAGQLIAFGIFLVVWALDSFLLDKTTFLSEYVPLYVRISGLIAAVAIAMSLIQGGHAATRHDEGPTRLITTGVFGYVRHPLYLGCVLVYFGLAFSTLSLASVVLAVATFVFYDFLASYEERFLESRFGDDYGSYRKKTGRWFPRPRRG